MENTQESAIEYLKSIGWRYVYFPGGGDIEEITEGAYVVGDIEKSNILVPPDCIWEEPVENSKYY